MSFFESPNPNPSMRYFILKGLFMTEFRFNVEEIQLDVLVGHDELDVHLQHELQGRAGYLESKVTCKVKKKNFIEK